MDILSIMLRNTPTGPTKYRQMYVHVFGALLMKVALKTSDSRVTMPSATNMEDYMESSPITTQAPLTPLKEETWDGGIAPLQQVPGNVMVIDPVVEDALVHINAPRQTNKTDKTYHRRRAAAIRHQQDGPRGSGQLSKRNNHTQSKTN
jgi:hypothetical protein